MLHEDDVIQKKVWKFQQSLILSKKLLYDRIVNRYSMEAIFNPKTNENQNEIITPEIAKAFEACGIEKVMFICAMHYFVAS